MEVGVMTRLGSRAAGRAKTARVTGRRVAATIAGIGSAFPPAYDQREIWDTFFAEHFRGTRRARYIWDRCGVEQRHAVADPRRDDLRFARTEERMRRFVRDGAELAASAVEACLADARLRRSDIGHLTVVSCTGYGTPGLDAALMDQLGLDPSVERLHVGDMGCYAALPALASASDTATARSKVALVVCMELTSLHVQPPTDDVSQIVAHSLFSDAAAAVAIAPDANGFEVVNVAARTATEHAALMTWDLTGQGFRMRLAPEVPRALQESVGPVVHALLASEGLSVADVRGWAIHPGGPAIIDVVGDRLGLDDADLAPARSVLAEHGNCSSPTVLLVLDRIRLQVDLEPGDHVVAMAFGPGLTLYTLLLRFTGSGTNPSS